MEKFVPFDKLSKKKQRELNAGRRNVWEINPVTRKPANPRAYNRRKAQNWKRDRSDSVLSLYDCQIEIIDLKRRVFRPASAIASWLLTSFFICPRV